jgi:hypothetical protein
MGVCILRELGEGGGVGGGVVENSQDVRLGR